MDDKVSFSINGVFGAIRAVAEFLLSLFHPVTQFMKEVAGQSWLGFAFVFAIGFTLLLIRWGVKSRAMGVYGASLEYIGRRGLIACVVMLALISLEYLVEPFVAIAVFAVTNTITGDEPGFLHLAGFVFAPSPERTAFLSDVATFYGEAHTAFPLGFRAMALVAVAFGCMFAVGKAAGRIPPAA